jgi:hypothetical protein
VVDNARDTPVARRVRLSIVDRDRDEAWLDSLILITLVF